MWGILCIILSVPQNIVMALNSVMYYMILVSGWKDLVNYGCLDFIYIGVGCIWGIEGVYCIGGGGEGCVQYSCCRVFQKVDFVVHGCVANVVGFKVDIVQYPPTCLATIFWTLEILSFIFNMGVLYQIYPIKSFVLWTLHVFIKCQCQKMKTLFLVNYFILFT